MFLGRIFVGILIGISLFLSGNIFAQKPDTVLARQLFELGNWQRAAGNYDSAFLNWSWAGDIYKQNSAWTHYATILYSIGKTYSEIADYDQGLKYLEESRDLSIEKIGEVTQEAAWAYYGLAWYYGAVGEYDLAYESQKKSLSIRLKLFGENNKSVVDSYNNLAFIYRMQGKYDSAYNVYAKALQITLKVLGDENTITASTYFGLGWVSAALGDMRKSLDLHKKALEIRLKILDPTSSAIATSYNNIGFCYNQLGDYGQASRFYQKALDLRIKRFGENHPNVASSYLNIAQLLALNGDNDRAILYQSKGIRIWSELYGIEDQEMARNYNYLGSFYFNKGEYRTALKYHLEALQVAEKKEQHPFLPLTYNYLGKVYAKLGDKEKQFEYLQKAQKGELEIFGPIHQNTANSYAELADFYKSAGNAEKEFEFLQKCLSARLQLFGEEHPDVAITYSRLGDFYRRKNNFDSAISNCQKGLISAVPGFNNLDWKVNPSLSGYYSRLVLLKILSDKATILAYFAQNLPAQDLLRQAFDTNYKAVQLLDTLRHGNLSEGSKQEIIANSLSTYELGIDLALSLFNNSGDKKYLKNAFSMMEKSKNFLLLVSLKNSRAQHFGEVPDSLIQAESNLKMDVSYWEQRVLAARKKGENSKALEYESRLVNSKFLYQSFLHDLRRSYPQYFSLKYENSPPKIEEIQNEILTKTGALIEYFAGEDNYFAFIITKDNVALTKIPNAGNLNVIAYNFRQSISDFDFISNNSSVADSMYCHSANFLFEQLLEMPLSAINEMPAKIIIIPDGILNHLNFDALLTTMPVDDKHLNYGSLNYAINDFQISLANSATILNSTGFSRKKMKPANIFAGFAPDYSGVAESDTLDNQFMAMLVRSGNLQLPGASEEVNLIANLVKGNAFTGANATEKLFKEVAGNYKILHLAMHGLIDDLEPLNSELVFTPVQDSINDGYLNLSEVYNLILHSELVVLSACNTGVGKIQKGEGNMSLSRAFRYAGSEGIIMSLWKVPDEATSEIMVDFYKNILNEKTKDQSLREAKLAFLKKYADDPLQSHPFFWAGFVPIGIMKPVELESNYFLVISFILGTMLLVLIIYSFRRRMSNRSVG